MKEKIIEIIRDACAIEENDITSQTKLQELSLDSLSFIEVIVNIEKQFDIEFEIDQADIAYWDKVEDIIQKVKELCGEKK